MVPLGLGLVIENKALRSLLLNFIVLTCAVFEH